MDIKKAVEQLREAAKNLGCSNEKELLKYMANYIEFGEPYRIRLICCLDEFNEELKEKGV